MSKEDLSRAKADMYEAIGCFVWVLVALAIVALFYTCNHL